MIIGEIIFAAVMLFLASFGAITLIRCLAGSVFSREKKQIVSVLPLRNGADTEMLLRAVHTLSSEGRLLPGETLAVDCGLNAAQRNIADLFCREHSHIRFITLASFLEEIQNGADA